MVHQESLLAPHLTVAENIFLGREPRRPLGWVDRSRMLERAARLIEEAELTGNVLANAIRDLLADPIRISAMEAAARRIGRPDAASRVADLLEGKAA